MSDFRRRNRCGALIKINLRVDVRRQLTRCLRILTGLGAMQFEIDEQVLAIVKRNALFYRDGPNDTNKYFIDPEILRAFASELLQHVIVPIVEKSAVSALIEYFKNAFKKPNVRAISDSEFAQCLTQLPELQASRTSIEKIKGILEFHGWPKSEAEADASKIVKIVLESQLEGNEDSEKKL